jgi:hypothetical protein
MLWISGQICFLQKKINWNISHLSATLGGRKQWNNVYGLERKMALPPNPLSNLGIVYVLEKKKNIWRCPIKPKTCHICKLCKESKKAAESKRDIEVGNNDKERKQCSLEPCYVNVWLWIDNDLVVSILKGNLNNNIELKLWFISSKMEIKKASWQHGERWGKLTLTRNNCHFIF